MRQHLTCVQAAVAVCGAKVEGAELGSQTLVFEPGPVRAGDYAFNVGTAGSCTLVLQTVLPALMLCAESSQVSLSGGTHNPMAPPFHFLERTYAPLLAKLGAKADLALRRLGFYPAGGGEIDVTIWPAKDTLPACIMKRRRKSVQKKLVSASSRKVRACMVSPLRAVGPTRHRERPPHGNRR